MKQIDYQLEPSANNPVVESPTPFVEFDGNKRRFPWGIILAVILFIIALSACAYLYFQTIEYTINSYEDCVASGNPVQESSPSTCVTRSGRRFQQPIPSSTPTASELPLLSPDPKISTDSGTIYECPISEWVDCMPSPDVDKSKTCSPEALTWFKTHCPGFQGAAY